MKFTTPIVVALTTLTACAPQGGAAPPVPMGCQKGNTAYGDSIINCVEPYEGAVSCCRVANPDATYPYTCWDSNVDNTPYWCDDDGPFDPSGGTGGTGGVGSDTGPWCAADCPEDMGGTCPGHAEWEKGIMIWGVYESNDVPGTYSITQGVDPVCYEQPVCYPYMDPDDIPGLNASMTQDLMAECNALTGGQLAALGIPATATGGASGYSRIDHVCVMASTIETDVGGNTLTDSATAAESSCLGGWTYEGFCAASDCPLEQGGSSDGLDDTGSESGPGAYDCSPLTSSDVAVNLRTAPKSITVRGDAAQMFIDDAYAPMLFCSDALMDSNGLKIWDIPSGSFLVQWGLSEDDVIHSVDGETTGIADALINAVNAGGAFDVQIARGTTLIDYSVEIVDPN